MTDVARSLGMVIDGIEAVEVTLEARRASSLRPQDIRLVGLPDTAVREGIHRARTATWPFVAPQAMNLDRGILVNLAPADLRKTGRSLDLPLAMVYAAVLLGIDAPRDLVFLGEIGLGGDVRAVPGVLAAMIAARRRGRRAVVVPEPNLSEARLVDGIALYAVTRIEDALAVLRGRAEPDAGRRGPPPGAGRARHDLAEVHGQHHARRALEIAAAGRHNLLLEGPPGSGKTMLARRLPGIIPPLSDDEALEAAQVRSCVRLLDLADFRTPPFRSPHHTASTAGLVGGGNPVRPGELTLAHHGVLFLDELPEFDRRALEALREPMEDRVVHVTRAGSSRRFPADFLCVAAMNPCPCGWSGLRDGRCGCTPRQVAAYRGRVSGPVLDRFDLRVFLRPVAPEHLLEDAGGETSAAVLARVLAARERQRGRHEGGLPNARVPDGALRRAQGYGAAERRLLLRLVTVHRLTGRAARRLERVARTIGDLEGSERVREVHLMEALGFRLGNDLEAAAEGAAAGTAERP